MAVANATEVKNRFGEFIDKAQLEPVFVDKNGRGYVVIVSREEYERLQALENEVWLEKAKAGRDSGYLSAEETAEILSSGLKSG